MVPTRYEDFFVFLKKGVWRSCAAVGLSKHCQHCEDTGIPEWCVPERRIFHEAPFHGFLECTRVFVHTTLAIKGGWRGFHTAGGTAIRTYINWKDSPQIVAKG
jgi:hypothetical protein